MSARHICPAGVPHPSRAGELRSAAAQVRVSVVYSSASELPPA